MRNIKDVKIVAIKDFSKVDWLYPDLNSFLGWVAYQESKDCFCIALCNAKTGELFFEENWGEENIARKAFALKGERIMDGTVFL